MLKRIRQWWCLRNLPESLCNEAERAKLNDPYIQWLEEQDWLAQALREEDEDEWKEG